LAPAVAQVALVTKEPMGMIQYLALSHQRAAVAAARLATQTKMD
jgi:hypothetical protein